MAFEIDPADQALYNDWKLKLTDNTKKYPRIIEDAHKRSDYDTIKRCLIEVGVKNKYLNYMMIEILECQDGEPHLWV